MADVTATFGALSSTESVNAPAGSTVIGSGLDENLRMMQAHVAAWRDQIGWGGITLTSVAGTNTVTATVATAGSVTFGPTALAANQRFVMTPAATNTGAVTLNITSPNGGSASGAKNVFWRGAALVGGELVINSPVIFQYDGTQFNIMGSGGVVGSTSSTFTFNGSGGTTGALTLSWQKMGNFVTLNIPSCAVATGTNSSTLVSNTALDALVRPATQQRAPATQMVDGGVSVTVPGVWVVGTNGMITLLRDALGANFTNSALAGANQPQTITYFLG